MSTVVKRWTPTYWLSPWPTQSFSLSRTTRVSPTRYSLLIDLVCSMDDIVRTSSGLRPVLPKGSLGFPLPFLVCLFCCCCCCRCFCFFVSLVFLKTLGTRDPFLSTNFPGRSASERCRGNMEEKPLGVQQTLKTLLSPKLLLGEQKVPTRGRKVEPGKEEGWELVEILKQLDEN